MLIGLGMLTFGSIQFCQGVVCTGDQVRSPDRTSYVSGLLQIRRSLTDLPGTEQSLAARFNRDLSGALTAPAEYLEVSITTEPELSATSTTYKECAISLQRADAHKQSA